MDEYGARQHERQGLLARLLDAVKQCQVRFGGRSELATDSDSRVSCLCATWEAALQHGMKKNNKALMALRHMTEKGGLAKMTDFFTEVKNLETEPTFWQYVKEHLTKHEIQRFNALRQINSDIGRGRAWLRACLNEHSLERYMHMLIEKEDLISQYYHEWAFMCDQERNSMLPTMSAGLGSVLFAITIDRAELNQPYNSRLRVNSGGEISVPGTVDDEPRPVIAGDSSPIVKKKEKKKKKKMVNVVNFDDNNSDPKPRRHSASKRPDDKPLSDTQHHSGSSSIASSVGNMSISHQAEARRETNEAQRSRLVSNPSMFSVGSVDGGSNLSSTGSVTSFDGDMGSCFMVPVRNSRLGDDGGPLSQNVPFTTDNIHSDASSEMSVFSRGDVDSAALALAMAQKGLVSARTEGDGGVSTAMSEQDHQHMSHAELRQAVVAMMVRKDEVEQQNRSLQAVLEKEMDTTSMLRADITELQQSAAQQREADRVRVEKLQKENDLLKHQLKKYVNAVQLLRTEGASKKDDELGIHLDDMQPSIPPPKSTIDYSHEASEYEQKLIQVAEMHGELMEFNEMLQRQLTTRDNALKQLRQELIILRGPLPYDEQEIEESGSAFMESLSLQTRALINIWIPSAFLRGTPSDQYHVYQVFVRIRDEEWNVFRRFSQFLDLHTRLKKVYPIVSKFEFPSKKTVGNKETKVVEARRQAFQLYLRRVINVLQEKNPELCTDTCKSKLVALLPFFGEDPEVGGKKGKKKLQQQRLQPSQPPPTSSSSTTPGTAAQTSHNHTSS
ncbi:sorting nexin-29-like [Babylonia areolata]|uniref:sorting nexin-29-like n=1 Tax=Babylonia areolata TaxID=304850 RepID=UPI003FD45FE1